jgi:hypothetical protein
LRKLALMTTALFALTGGIAHAVNPAQTISVKVSPATAGTAQKAANVGLDVLTTTTPVAGEKAFAVTRAVIRFDKNLTFNPAKFAKCDLAAVENAAGTTCTSRSKIGSGSGQALAGGLGGVPAALNITAYNGGGKTIYLLVENTTFNLKKALVGTLRNATGKYGKKLDVVIPAGLQTVAGLPITLTAFNVKVKGLSKGVPYAGLKGCSGGKLHFAGQFFYNDGSSKSATSSTSCKAAKRK